MPTARKFHYQFNLRDFSKITMNLMNAQPHIFKGQPLQLVRMWAHECHRVWLDRLLFPEDVDAYMNMMRAGIKQFPDMKEEVIFEEPLVYTSFVAACKGHEATYMSIKDMEDLRNVLEAKMAEYNENVGSMDLVLFGIACEHITRIARIIDQPCGNALLVGVGGSGKQSLGKLTAFILGQEVFRIVVTSNYSMNDLKLDIQNAFTKAGVAGIPLFFILTDSQIPKDNFLVYINDILSAGYIPDLFAKDELDEKINKIRSEAKSQGIEDSPNTLFQFFVDKVRKNLHIGLCFSPVGEAFRVRGRQFPGLINSTTIDWFHEWPEDALVGVAKKFLKDIAFPSEEISNNLASHMAFVHLSISTANSNFLQQCRRYNYTTPTSFLELISFYKALLGSKTDRISE
jgi:dynein heavy chain